LLSTKQCGYCTYLVRGQHLDGKISIRPEIIAWLSSNCAIMQSEDQPCAHASYLPAKENIWLQKETGEYDDK
jgi:hypothetical protein